MMLNSTNLKTEWTVQLCWGDGAVLSDQQCFVSLELSVQHTWAVSRLVTTDRTVCFTASAVGGEARWRLWGGPAAPLSGGQESKWGSVVCRLPLPSPRQLCPNVAVTSNTRFLTAKDETVAYFPKEIRSKGTNILNIKGLSSENQVLHEEDLKNVFI